MAANDISFGLKRALINLRTQMVVAKDSLFQEVFDEKCFKFVASTMQCYYSILIEAAFLRQITAPNRSGLFIPHAID